MGPGVICEMATMSVNALSLIQPWTLTTWACIRESMAYPPPKVKAPITKNVQKSWR